MQRQRGDGGEGELRRRKRPAPGLVVVKLGTTMLSVASVATVASDAPAPSALNETADPVRVPARIDKPTMPLLVGITAANVSRGFGRPGASDHQRDDERDFDHGHRHGEPVSRAVRRHGERRPRHGGQQRAPRQRSAVTTPTTNGGESCPRERENDDAQNRDERSPGEKR